MKSPEFAPSPHLGHLDMTVRLEKADYKERLKKVQKKFVKIQQAYLRTGDSAAIVFEGWDAAGKGGTIRRMSTVMDPRGFKVWPIAAPSPDDMKHHYMARFWERLPIKGEIAVFDRSWYGRVLVERVEGYATEAEWRRAYDEIVAFENSIQSSGIRIAKIFLYITPEEQFVRFRDRMEDPLKRWKLSYEDFRNRDKWGLYEEAANDMFAKTHTSFAPWTVIAANDKHFARITALETIADCLAAGVDLKPQQPTEKLLKQYEKMRAAEQKP
ncbi:polyphosphate kinase [Aureimonas fodinaquatilis]|uniref:Polyphosphate kinase n=1 Tax=Aureimonas fodinaquatilis TaxID=2565783 RepID=A0A5B0DVR6_9HYPH|nr:polyphosphate kinase [Aureimonas fodinaquatilis]KAA0970112.1 polyphosphate kinase [Aureimonas fodinaquatilis]